MSGSAGFEVDLKAKEKKGRDIEVKQIFLTSLVLFAVFRKPRPTSRPSVRYLSLPSKPLATLSLTPLQIAFFGISRCSSSKKRLRLQE